MNHKKLKHAEFNTLGIIAVGTIGCRTTLELQNDAYVNGKVIFADAAMNFEMQHAYYTDANGKCYLLEKFYVKGRKIRYIHIPDEMGNIEQFLQKAVQPLERRVIKQTTKQKIMKKRDETTVKQFIRRNL